MASLCWHTLRYLIFRPFRGNDVRNIFAAWAESCGVAVLLPAKIERYLTGTTAKLALRIVMLPWDDPYPKEGASFEPPGCLR